MEIALIVLGVVALAAVVAVIMLLRRGGVSDEGPNTEDQIPQLMQQLAVLNTQVENLQNSQGTSAQELREALASRTKELRDSVAQETANLQKQVIGQTNALQQAVTSQGGTLQESVSQRTELLQKEIQRLTKAQEGKGGEILGQLKELASTQQQMSLDTNALTVAMGKPGVRGDWGETTLRNVIEKAGLTEHVDFEVHQHLKGGEDQSDAIPDVVIRLPDSGHVPVDAKMPLDAFQDAIDAGNEKDTKAALQRHVQSVRQKIRDLSSKAYWDRFQRSPEVVVMFIGSEAAFSAASAEAPDLIDEAAKSNVVIATPATLIASLQAIRFVWREKALSENAEEVQTLANEIAERLNILSTHLTKVGSSLDSAVGAYNSTVSSYETRLMVTARKLGELGVKKASDLESVEGVDRVASAPKDQLSSSEAAAIELGGGDAGEDQDLETTEGSDFGDLA